MTVPVTPDTQPEPLDLNAITSEWLNQCGMHDFGIAGHGCACPDGDYRPVMMRLVQEVALLRGPGRRPTPRLDAVKAERDQALAAIERVESLCRSYTPEPPPIFRGPGLSEFGQGNNHGMRTLANAVLGTLRGEQSDDDACCAECRTGGHGDD